MKNNRPFNGMFGFSMVALGQLVSLVGSAMSRFALVFWAYQLTGKATALALMSFFSFTPTIILSPLAGVFVDRWNRKLVMMLSDIAAGLCTIAIFILYSANLLEIWYLYLLVAIAGAFNAFQFPAYSAAITMMVPKNQYGRANGILSTARTASYIIAPPLAALALGIIGIGGVIFIDVITFIFACGMLLLVHIPQPEKKELKTKPTLLSDTMFGFNYIRKHPGLLGLQITFLMVNLSSSFANILIPATVLARTGNNELILGSVQSAAGIGGLIGGLIMSSWGGPKQKVKGLLGSIALQSILGYTLVTIGRTPFSWMLGLAFIVGLSMIANGCSQTIWQSKVEPAYQGRVFAARATIAEISTPLAMLIAGPLADYILEPAMLPTGKLAPYFGNLVGTGSGSGMALIILFAGSTVMITALIAYLNPVVRNIESSLPDHDMLIENTI